MLLSSNFEMKDLGGVDVILGIKISNWWRDWIISISLYWKDIKKFGKYNAVPRKTLCGSSIHLKKHTEKNISQLEYSQIRGSLMNITVDTIFCIPYLDLHFHQNIITK